MNNFITTIDYGNIPLRTTHTTGKVLDLIELSDGSYAEVKRDYSTFQPFAVMVD